MRVCTGLGVTLLLSAVAQGGTVLYTDLGTGTSVYNGTTGYTVGGSQVYAQGDAFSPSSTALLGAIEIALSFVGGADDTVTISLDSSSRGMPGATLETWTVGALPDFGTCCSMTTVVPDSAILLHRFLVYWLVISSTADISDVFNQNTIGATGPHAESIDGGPWQMYAGQPQGAFEVLGPQPESASAPEPATLLLAGGVLAMFGATRKFKGRR